MQDPLSLRERAGVRALIFWYAIIFNIPLIPTFSLREKGR
jgi:hypothetical protein